MGGGSFYNHNIINNMNNYIPLTGQSQQQSQEQQTHDGQEQRRQQYHNRVGRKKKKKKVPASNLILLIQSSYNPFLHHQPSWSSNSTSCSVASVYPSYDPSEFHLDPIPLIAPELPPRPAAYRQISAELPIPTPINVHIQTPATQPLTTFNDNNNNNSNNDDKVRLVYTKSGFYLKSTNPMEDHSIHGFLAILSKSMVFIYSQK